MNICLWSGPLCTALFRVSRLEIHKGIAHQIYWLKRHLCNEYLFVEWAFMHCAVPSVASGNP